MLSAEARACRDEHLGPCVSGPSPVSPLPAAPREDAERRCRAHVPGRAAPESDHQRSRNRRASELRHRTLRVPATYVNENVDKINESVDTGK
jgi:hypothetical protein